MTERKEVEQLLEVIHSYSPPTAPMPFIAAQ